MQQPQPPKCTAPPVTTYKVPQPHNNQNSQSFDVPDRYAEQIKLRREWEERIEGLNRKYSLNYYSSSESDSYYNPEPDHRYEHKYDTHMNNFYPLNYWKNHKAKVKFAMNSLKFIMHIKSNFSSNFVTKNSILIFH